MTQTEVNEQIRRNMTVNKVDGLPVGRLAFNNPLAANQKPDLPPVKGTDAGSQMVALFQQQYSLTWEQAVAAAKATDEMIRKHHGAAAAPAVNAAVIIGTVPGWIPLVAPVPASAQTVNRAEGNVGLAPAQLTFANPLAKKS